MLAPSPECKSTKNSTLLESDRIRAPIGRRRRLAVLALVGGMHTLPALANDALLEVLRSKAILTEGEYAQLKGQPAVTHEALLTVLKAKGILSAEEHERLLAHNPAAPTVIAAAPGAARTAVAASDTAGARADRRDAGAVVASYKDGVVFENAASGFSLALNGRMHADYRTYSDSRYTTGAVDTFEVRRARLGVNTTFFTYRTKRRSRVTSARARRSTRRISMLPGGNRSSYA